MDEDQKNEVKALDSMPDYGNETMTFDDVSKPFLRILQALSPVCIKSNPNFRLAIKLQEPEIGSVLVE